VKLSERAMAEGVAFVPGVPFFPDGRGRNNLRLAFSRIDDEVIPEGCAGWRPSSDEPQRSRAAMTDADRYFAMDPKMGEGATGGTYVEVDKDVSAVEFVPGLVFRPVVGDQLMANFVRYNPNTAAPLHTHEEEQITVVIEGELEFDLAGDLRIMGPGMAVVVPSGVRHGARTHDTSCFEIDIFHPPRRALLELTQASGEHLS
jgi:quercetin dioxygenase-like cupin family protein